MSCATQDFYDLVDIEIMSVTKNSNNQMVVTYQPRAETLYHSPGLKRVDQEDGDYFKVVRVMYLTPATDESPIPSSIPLTMSLILMLAGTVFLGLYPGPVIQFVQGILIV